MQSDSRRQEYWSRNLRITAILLALWFVVTFVIGWYARDLSFNFFGWQILVVGVGKEREHLVVGYATFAVQHVCADAVNAFVGFLYHVIR